MLQPGLVNVNAGSKTLLEVKNVVCADFQEGHVPTGRAKVCGQLGSQHGHVSRLGFLKRLVTSLLQAFSTGALLPSINYHIHIYMLVCCCLQPANVLHHATSL